MVEKIEKASVDLFSGAKNVDRFRDINAAIKKTMSKLKEELDGAMEERYCTRDISEATHRFTQLKVERSSRPKDLEKEKSDILASLASF